MSKRQRKTNKVKRLIQRGKDYRKKIKRYENALGGKLGQKGQEVLKKLKSEPYSVLHKVYCNISNNHLALERFSGGNVFPSSYSNISRVINMPFTSHIESELTWTGFVISKYSERINEFLELKEKYDSSILRGDYSLANEILSQVENDFGFSLWLIESKLLLAEYQGGLESNRTILEEIINICKNNNNLCILASYLSFRAEKDISYANFSNALHGFLSMHKSNTSLANILIHLRFKLDFMSFGDFESLAAIIHLESTFPIIDRYLSYVRVVKILACGNNPKKKVLVLKEVSHLKEIIHDASLNTLMAYLEPSHDIPVDELQLLLLQGYDAYTVGEYDKSLNIASSILLKKQHRFKVYELYVKSLLHLQKDFEALINEDSLSVQIMECLYNVIAKNEKTDHSVDKLFKIGYALGNNYVSSSIFAFIIKHKFLDGKNDFITLGELSALPITPRFAMIIGNRKGALEYLRNQKTRHARSATIEFFLKIMSNEDLPNNWVPENRKLKYQIRRNIQEKNCFSAITKLNKLEQITSGPSPYQTDILVLLFECYLEEKKYEDCLHLIVDTYLSNRNLLLPLNLNRFYDAISNVDINKNSQDICWPILESIFQQLDIFPKNKWAIYVTLDDFMNAIGVEKPSKLNKFERAKLIYLLRYVCIPEVLEDTIGVYESSEDIENERINICQILINLDPDNEEIYSDEIKRLMQEQMTRKAIQHIDKRRIHIETEGVLNTLGALYQERFGRCLGFSRLDEVLRKSPNNTLLSQLNENDRPVVVVSDVAYGEFEKLFGELKSRFISSNEYGLDSYLSVRIRHGTLSGQIRSHFENENLITRKNARDNVYAPNKYWIESVFGRYGEQVLDSADGHLKQFSKKVDDIIEYINATLIQIKSVDNPEGIFDYNYNEKEIANLWVKIFVRDVPIEYVEFLDIIIKELWSRTEDNLSKARHYIRNNLKDSLTEILEELSLNINDLNLNYNVSVFSNSVLRCRTNIQNELETISEWFRVTEEKTFPDFSLVQLVDTTLSMVRKCYPSIHFDPRVTVKSEINVNGKRFEGFVDIMFIVLENIAKHSNIQLGADVHVDNNKGTLNMQFSNKIPESVSIIDSKLRVDKLKRPEKNAELMKFTRKEGGSGYYKLHKILRHDLECEEYEVDFNIEEKSRTFSTNLKMNLEGMIP